MRIIFLDIDGVLNNQATRDQFGMISNKNFLEEGLNTIITLCKTFGAKIVIHSSWRDDSHCVKEILKSQLGVFVIGLTDARYVKLRSIAMWLYQNAFMVESFCIIEDDDIISDAINAHVFMNINDPETQRIINTFRSKIIWVNPEFGICIKDDSDKVTNQAEELLTTEVHPFVLSRLKQLS